MSGRHVVLGIGNILNRDEGLGVRALDLLEERVGVVPDVEYVDGGVMGLTLLPLVEECDHLLVLDAIDAGAEPGELIEMSGDEIRLFSGVKMSEHQITFQEVLGLAFIRDKLPPHLHLIGAQPASLSIGLEISDRVRSTLSPIVVRAAAVLRDWGFEVPDGLKGSDRGEGSRSTTTTADPSDGPIPPTWADSRVPSRLGPA